MRKTLRGPITLKGRGIHTGELSEVVINPAPEAGGIIFYIKEFNLEIPATIDYVRSTLKNTVIGRDTIEIHTVEHILSALWGMDIDDAVVELKGREPPAMDGSAFCFAEKVREVGVQLIGGERNEFVVKEVVRYKGDTAEIQLLPYKKGLKVTFELNYKNRIFPPQTASFDITPESYLREIAPARTFVFIEELGELSEMGLARGGNLVNAIVITEEGVLNPPLRFPDEPVRHKIQDLIGDLSLLGRRLKGHIVASKSGHRDNLKFIKKLRGLI